MRLVQEFTYIKFNNPGAYLKLTKRIKPSKEKEDNIPTGCQNISDSILYH